MTTLALRQSVMRDLASMMDNDEYLKRISKFLKKLKKEEKEESEYLTEAERQEVLNDIREGLREAKLYREGKIELQTLDEFLDELHN